MDKKVIYLSDEFYFNSAEGSAGYASKTHYHNRVEIYYMKDGECNYFIGSRSYKVQKGDIILIPDGVIHRTNYSSKRYTRWLVNCSSEYLPESVRKNLNSLPNFYRDEKITAEAERIFGLIGKEYASQSEYRKDALICLTGELTLLLARLGKQEESTSTGSPFIEKTVQYIQENYGQDITLSEMANLAMVSPEHLSRTFKKETGFGFSEYLTLVRLQRAEYVLKNEPGKSVNEVAFACGFNDSNYFSYKFKKVYGKAPSTVKSNKKS